MSEWVYKRICRRCGCLKVMSSKHSKICEDCILPKYGETLAVKKIVKKYMEERA